MCNLKPFLKMLLSKLRNVFFSLQNIKEYNMELCKFNTVMCLFHISVEKIKFPYYKLSLSENLYDPVPDSVL